METKSQQNIGDNKPKVAKKEAIISFLEKKETKISIALAFLGMLVTVFFAYYDPPEKEDKIFRKNQGDGKNQLAVRRIPPVKCFLDYLDCIEKKDTLQMWERSSSSRRSKDYANTEKMMYDYFLTSTYKVEYIIPVKEENKIDLDSKGPTNEHTFSFYALLEFEDDVRLEGEVDKLKNFDITTNLKQIRDSVVFESLFEPVLQEVYAFLDRRFVIDSAELVKKELRDYMLNNMTLKKYITQDWRFPILFASDNKLSPKQIGPIAPYERQKHKMLSEVVMIDEDGAWKVKVFKTKAISRW